MTESDQDQSLVFEFNSVQLLVTKRALLGTMLAE